MSLELDPQELGFRRPFTHEVSQVLRLSNPTAEPIAFKVKTTAPKQYCVRPNSGRIEPLKHVEVQVLLQAMREDPPPDAKCRDKFLVQSVSIGDDQDVGDVATIWQNIEKISKDVIKERKIRVVFLPSHDSSTPQQSHVNGYHLDEAAPPYSSTASTYASPSHDTVVSRDTRTEDTSTFGSAAGAVSNAASNTATLLTNATSNAASATSQTLQQQLEAAKATIAQLRSQSDGQGLRQRKGDAILQDSRDRITTGATAMGAQAQTASGVPVQVVAALCLLSFLLAYLFF